MTEIIEARSIHEETVVLPTTPAVPEVDPSVASWERSVMSTIPVLVMPTEAMLAQNEADRA